MVDNKVAKRYARALFNVAKQSNVIESVESDLNAIANLVENHPDFRGFLASPRISRDEKIGIAERLFSDRVTALTMNMLRLMLVKRRENEFSGVREEFVILRRSEGNILYASVVSAAELDEATKNALVAKLEQKAGKKVEADFRVDPNLIGGVKVALGNYVLDGSVRGSLNRLRDRLKYDVLKQN